MNNENIRLRSRIGMIGLAIVLLSGVVLLVGTSLQQNNEDPILEAEPANGSPSRPTNVEEFEQLASFTTQLNEAEDPANGRDLATYYDRRAYIGAPPVVPHPVDDQSFGGNSCLQCHETGDYVPRYETYAPIVPHPGLTSCNQCHVAVTTNELFVESEWLSLGAPPLGQSALPGSPPPVPHGLEMRDDCLSCHAGPAAPVEIRVSHPERESCLQCHVLSESGEEWER